MLNLLREAARDVSEHDFPPSLREFRPHKLYYPVPFQFKPLPPTEYVEKWVIWKSLGSRSWPLPFYNFLFELDVIDIVVGGTTMFLYAFISGEISHGYHYVWPSAHNFIEDIFPIQRVSTYLGVRCAVLGRYAARFALGGFVYSLVRKGAAILINDRFTPFRTSLITGTIFSLCWARNYNTTQRPIWRWLNGLWTGLGMAYFEHFLLSYHFAISNLSPSDMPFRIR